MKLKIATQIALLTLCITNASAVVPKGLQNIKETVDQIERTLWYTDTRTPTTPASNNVSAYIGRKGESTWLRMVFRYTADTWLFIDKAIVVVDGRRMEFTGNWQRDNSSRIWEWLDIQADRRTFEALQSIASGKTVVLRYEGRQYRSPDRTLSNNEKAAISNILKTYAALGGVPPSN